MDPTTPHDPQFDTTPLPASAPPAPTPAAPPVWATPAAPPVAPPDPALASASTGWGPAPVMPGPVTGVKPKAPRRRDPLSIVLVIAAFVALGGVGFAFGRVTAPAAAAPNARGAFPGNGGAFAFPSGGFGGNGGGLTRGLGGNVAIRGTVTAITDTEVTITVTGGGTVNIPISGTTTYHNETAGSASDVRTGSTVLVQLGQGAGGGPDASPGASPGAGGRTLGTAQDITIVAK